MTLWSRLWTLTCVFLAAWMFAPLFPAATGAAQAQETPATAPAAAAS